MNQKNILGRKAVKPHAKPKVRVGADYCPCALSAAIFHGHSAIEKRWHIVQMPDPL